jgi:hypothetical protein
MVKIQVKSWIIYNKFPFIWHLLFALFYFPFSCHSIFLPPHLFILLYYHVTFFLLPASLFISCYSPPPPPPESANRRTSCISSVLFHTSFSSFFYFNFILMFPAFFSFSIFNLLYLLYQPSCLISFFIISLDNCHQTALLSGHYFQLVLSRSSSPSDLRFLHICQFSFIGIKKEDYSNIPKGQRVERVIVVVMLQTFIL